MEQANATPPALPIAQPVAPESGLLATWPRCVQIAVAVQLALGIGFLLGRSFTTDSVGRIGNPAFSARRADDDGEVAGARLDLNRATRAELALLHGLGPARAQSIDDYRRQHGPFHNVDDLRKVSGIGPKTLDKIRPWLFVNDITAALAQPPPEAAATMARPASAPSTKANKAASLTNAINVNRADAAELQKVPGIGPKTAQRILDERTLRGPFKTVDELRRVPGIGPKTLEKVRPYVVVDVPLTVAGAQ